jgi:membrane-associated phospholipid phosphatase
MSFVGRSVDADAYRTLYSALGEPNSVASVPSIHMAVTFAVFLWARRFWPAVAPLCFVYSLLMAVSLVYLAEHYVLDLLLGVVIAVIIDQIVSRLWARHGRTESPRVTA